MELGIAVRSMGPQSRPETLLACVRAAEDAGAKPQGVDFGQMVQEAVETVVDKGRQADDKAVGLIEGRTDVVDVVTAIAETEVALETMVAVRAGRTTSASPIVALPTTVSRLEAGDHVPVRCGHRPVRTVTCTCEDGAPQDGRHVLDADLQARGDSAAVAVAQTVPPEDVIVNAIDACDPDSFNAAVGAGTCVRAGGLKFGDFIAQLTKHGFVGPWHFAPNTVNARTGQEFLVINHGGEVHTFTEVEEFGLNDRVQRPRTWPPLSRLGSVSAAM